jgi:hypothetical protein
MIGGLLLLTLSASPAPIVLSRSVVRDAYALAYQKDQTRALAISDNPGVPMYPTRFSKAYCHRISEAALDCRYRVKLPLDGGWQDQRATFSKQTDSTWVLTHTK